MRSPLFVAVTFAFVLATSGMLAQTPAPVPQPVSSAAYPPGNVENGKRLFMTYYCYACHGTVAQGGSAGARLVPQPASPAALIKYVRKPTGGMPPYTSEVIPEQALIDIHAFLRAIPASPAAKNIALLNQ